MTINVLVLDDNEDVVKFVNDSLKRESSDAQVVAANTIDDAIKSCRDERFDVIIAGHHMLDLSDSEFMREFKKASHNAPFIALSQAFKDRISIKAVDLGDGSGLEKGWESDSEVHDLIQTIRSVVNHSREKKDLEASEGKYRRLAEESMQGLAIMQDGRYVYVNPTFANTLGRSINELLAMTSDQTWELVHPDDIKELQERNKRLQVGEELPKHEFRYVRQDGSVRWVESFVRGTEYEGKNSVQIVEIDVTSRKAAEEELQKTWHALRKRIKELECLYGVTSLLANQEQPAQEIFPVLVEMIRTAMQFPSIAQVRLATDGIDIKSVDYEETEWKITRDIIVSSKKIGVLEVCYLENRSEEGESLFPHEEEILLDAIAREVADYLNYRQAKVALQESLSELKASEKTLRRQKEELSEFAHEMAHDLRSGLFAVGGYAELLQEKDEPEYAKQIVSTIETMSDLLTRSVELADAGLIIGEKTEVNLNDIVDSISSKLIPEEITFVRDDLPSIKCDGVKMSQLVQNLVINAVEHANPSKIEVLADEGEDGTSLLFRNDGVPITPEFRKLIFEKSFTTREGGGRGLMIVRKIAEAHDWKVSLDPTIETAFRVFIPTIIDESE